MNTLKALIIELHEDEAGVTATEYVSILVLVACVSIASVQLLGTHVTELYTEVHEGMSNGEIRGGLASDD